MAQDQPNKLPLRPLLPKGTTPISRRGPVRPRAKASHPSETSSRSIQCRVPLCQRVDCKLQSHLSFDSKSTSSKSERHANRAEITPGHTHAITHRGIGSLDAATTSDAMVLFYDGLHRLPDLPVENAAYAPFRQLFHDFFLNYYDRLELITAPPPVSVTQKARMATWAESNEVIFLNIIALTHNLQKTIAAERHNDLATHYFHAKVTRLLLRKLHETKGMDLENVTLIVCTLISLEIMNGNLKHLLVHRNGLDELIVRQGGIHNLTFSLRNTLHMDRVMSVYTCTPPRYARPPDNSIRRPRRYLETLGFHFDCLDAESSIDAIVVEHCLDLCEVLEEFSIQRVSYDPRAVVASISPNLPYFYFLRDRVAINFCYLNSKYSQQNNKSRCILLASKIIEYPILYSNWIVDLPMFLANKLQELLLEHDLDCEWLGNEDILIWILFVLVTMPNAWKGHDWALRLLRDRLNVKHGGSQWPKNWRALERAELSNFIWNQATLDQSFYVVCLTLVWEPTEWGQTEQGI